jgi:hypothetical protein
MLETAPVTAMFPADSDTVAILSDGLMRRIIE